ncbi:MAG: bifunctional metallophosphatase/5'-nucleotidase [Actinomycetota bacterium]
MGKRRSRRTVVAVLAAMVAMLTTVVATSGASADSSEEPKFTLTVLHNNDGESSLLPLDIEGVSYGGVARFQSKVDELRRSAKRPSFDEGEAPQRGSVLLNSGDNFLAGPTFEASRQGNEFYDARAVRLLGYDALAIGNHEFDFGPETFARFVRQVAPIPFVSANLDYSGEPSLARLAGRRLVSSDVITENGRRIGIVGLTTPSLPTISSPGGVEVLTDLAGLAQAEVDDLQSRGVDIIILMSHLQGLDSELALVSALSGVDVVIGGGGDEILADEGDELFPGHADNIFGSYPQVATDADGNDVPVVTTPGNYRYVGALEVTFDRDGNVLFWDEEDSGIKLVTDSGPEAVEPNRRQANLVEEPVADFIAELAATIIGSSDVVLDCERVEVRGVESNCANLVADAHLATGQAQAAAFGLDAPQMAIMNGGGVRGEIDQPVGPISVADTFRIQPFGNFVGVANDVPAETVRQIIEEGAIRLPAPGDGGFAQLAGASVVIDPSFPARDADQTTGEQFSPGERVRELVLDDGTVLVTGGVTQDVTVDIAGLSFSLGGGDAYPAVPFTTVGISDQQSLQNFIENDLGGNVTAADYPRGGEGRLTIIGVS